MKPVFKEWFAKIQEESKVFSQLSEMYKTHYPFIAEGYSDLLEDSEWSSRACIDK